MVYLLPRLSYLAGSKSVLARPSDLDTMTNTALEAIASSGGKNHFVVGMAEPVEAFALTGSS